MQPSPFAMPRKVADVFVVMKGEVPDSIFKNNNIIKLLQFHTSNINTNKKEAASEHEVYYKQV